MTAVSLRAGTLKLERDKTHRMGLVQVAKQLTDAVTTPTEKLDTVLPQISHVAVLHVFYTWNAFELIPKAQEPPITYTELADKLGADVSLTS
jgi:hypothetical protein